MKTPNSTKAELSAPAKGASFITAGAFSAKCVTVSAGVLARFLGHERLTSLETVHDAIPIRLSVGVQYLAESYGWNIMAQDKVVGCRDGRISWVSEYHLQPETIARAITGGAGNWCAKVRKDQALNAAQKRQAPTFQLVLLGRAQHG